jgi:hypothetical protein
MLNQPHVDELYIFYPKYAQRLKKAYPEPPATLKNLPRVRIIRSEDHGPLTKAYPSTDLPNLCPTTGIILFDDDRIYPDNWTSRLVEEYRKRDGRAGVGYSGAIPVTKLKGILGRWNKGKNADRVGVLQTTFMAMYPRAAFPENSQSCIESLRKLSSAAFTNDDFVLGTWAHRNKVPLILVTVTQDEIDEFVRVNVEDDAVVHQGGGVRMQAKTRQIRAMIPTDDALTVSSGQQMKQLRLALGYTTSNKLPCPRAWILVWVFLIVFIVLVITLPIVLVRKAKQPKSIL